MGTRGCVERATPAKIAAVEKQRQALLMRKDGMTFEEIARRLGYRNRNGAYYAIERALTATVKEPADELRTLELARLDAIWTRMYAKALQGDHLAVDRCLRIMQRRA